MNILNINRKIFNKLKAEEEIVKEYLFEVLELTDIKEELTEEYDNLVDGLYKIISSNEKLIEKVGLKDYYNSNYEAKDYIEGSWYQSGKYGLIAFDWSMEDENDDKWNYSFNVFKIL